MKKVLLTITLAGFAASVLAQGTINYFNNGTGFKAPVYGPEAGAAAVSKIGNTTAGIPAGTQVYTGAMLEGGNFRAQLFAGAAGTTEGNLVGATTVNTFRTGTARGFLAVAVATFTNLAADAPAGAVAQLRAWDNSSGLYPTWAEASVAWAEGRVAAGVSPLLTVNSALGGGVNPAANMVGLQSFNIYMIPEPSTFALAGLGAAALLIFRRRK